jgi:hypothetical protein
LSVAGFGHFVELSRDGIAYAFGLVFWEDAYGFKDDGGIREF